MKEFVHIVIQTATHLHWIDYLILVAIGLYALEGYVSGFILALFDIINFFAAFAAGLLLYKPIGNFFTHFLHIPNAFAHVAGFVIAAFVAELLLRFVQNWLYGKLHKMPGLVAGGFWMINKVLGIVPGMLSGTILITFFLTVLAVLPINATIKQAVGDSTIGSFLVGEGQNFEKTIMQAVGGGKNDLLTFTTVEPAENTSIQLHIQVKNGTIDEVSEDQMLRLVNRERSSRKLDPLTMNKNLQKLARDYGREMFARGYFSHYTPEGMSPFDRMNEANISYFYAGENLAYSPNVTLAMQGLMASPGHRANILSPNFRNIGIGAIDGGIYGEMFVQEFTD